MCWLDSFCLSFLELMKDRIRMYNIWKWRRGAEVDCRFELTERVPRPHGISGGYGVWEGGVDISRVPGGSNLSLLLDAKHIRIQIVPSFSLTLEDLPLIPETAFFVIGRSRMRELLNSNYSNLQSSTNKLPGYG